MKLSFRNKKKTSVIAIFLVLSVAGAAFAYFTAGGDGDGTATTTETDPLTANQTSVITEMGPGDSAQTLSGNFDNPNAGPVYVTSVTASKLSVTGNPGVCTVADYTLANPVMTVGHEVAAGLAQDAWTGATIKFNNTASNQDGCQGATLNIHYEIT